MNSKEWRDYFTEFPDDPFLAPESNKWDQLIADLAACEERAVPPERFHDLLEKEARYDSLLAVLKRCVEMLHKIGAFHDGVRCPQPCTTCWAVAEALSAAREILEAK